jgi:hypothetical protein
MLTLKLMEKLLTNIFFIGPPSILTGKQKLIYHRTVCHFVNLWETWGIRNASGIGVTGVQRKALSNEPHSANIHSFWTAFRCPSGVYIPIGQKFMEGGKES